MARNDFQSNYLAHHGILGQKWGIRRYQNPDGSLTSAGRERYGIKEGGGINDISSAKGISRRLNDVDKAIARNNKKIAIATSKMSTDNFKRRNVRLAKKSSDAQSNVTKGKTETEALLKKAEKMGYDVSSQYTRRLVSSGLEIIGGTLRNSAIASLALSAITLSPHVVGVPSWMTAAGKKYSVKDPNEKTFKEKFAEANQKARERTSINAAAEKGIAEYKAREAAKTEALEKKAQDADEYKKIFKEWNNAEQKYYWGTDSSKSKELGRKAEELGRKEAAAQEALRAKGYSDNEIGKMMDEALKEDPSYHKYEEEYHKWRKKNNSI